MFSSSVHLPAKFKMLFFFCCVVLHCVNVPHFPYLFFSQGAFRLFPGSGYDKQCWYQHSWAHVFVAWLSIFWIYTQKWYYWVLRKVVSSFSEKLPHCHPKELYQLAFLPAMQECSLFSTTFPARVVNSVFDLGHSYRCKMESQSCFDLHFSDG